MTNGYDDARLPRRESARRGDAGPALRGALLALGAMLVVTGRAADPTGSVATPAVSAVSPVASARFSPEQRAFWFFQPLVGHPADAGSAAIDRTLESRARDEGVPPVATARAEDLVRRVSFDLLGMPPRAEEVQEFVADEEPERWEKLVDRGLASPRFGERLARGWLDVVRYAESNGHRADEYRPNAWRYRDWVIDSFNEDKSWERFVTEQLAGDEAFPGDPEALVATGFLRLWPYESNQKDVRRQWREIIDDLSTVSGEVFLGMSLGCARCHDHKFDPIAQTDYYAFRAFFAPIVPEDELPVASVEEIARHDAQLARWEEATRGVREKIAAIEREPWEKQWESKIRRFPEELQPVLRAPLESLSPREAQLRHLATWQIAKEAGDVADLIRGDAKKDRDALLVELASFDTLKPASLPLTAGVREVGRVAPRNTIEHDHDPRDIAPGPLGILRETLGDAFAEDIVSGAVLETSVETGSGVGTGFSTARDAPRSTGRRTALARWIARPDNAISARVIVNRLWQHAFGRGLVATPNDFGTLGARPSHPELLDAFARRFGARGGSFKDALRTLLLTRAYRRGAGDTADARAVELFVRRAPTRLEAESLRDAFLAAAGELTLDMHGASVDAKRPRRAIYLRRHRNTREAMMDAFDAPDGFTSCAARAVTTTAPQALLLLNGEWTLARADAIARRVADLDAPAAVERVYRLALARDPRAEERAMALEFLDAQSEAIAAESKLGEDDCARAARADLAHVLLNSNLFLYLD